VDAAIESESMEMQQIHAQQDVVLDDMSVALGRLGVMSETIGREIKESTVAIDELTEQVDIAQEQMGINLRRLDRLLGQSDVGKYCCIFLLFAVAVILFFVIVYG